MAERKIDPKFNIHQNYNRVNIVNPYRYDSGGGAPVGGVDADYQAVLDFASNNAIPLPSSAQQEIDNQLMIDYKATGVYDKRDVIFKANGTADPNFKLICWKRKIKMVAYSGLTWDEFGVLPNGSTGYIDPLWDAASSGIYLTGDAGYDFVLVTTQTSALCIVGYYDGGVSTYVNLYQGGSSSQASLHGSFGTGTSWMNVGYNAVSRNGSTINVNNGTHVSNVASTGRVRTPYIFARHRDDIGSQDIYFRNKASFISMGASVLNEYASLKTLLE